jgi:hypothetical protein
MRRFKEEEEESEREDTTVTTMAVASPISCTVELDGSVGKWS